MAGSEDFFSTYNNLFVKQTKKGWCQECFGCEANTEFVIATKENQKEDIMYALEDTSCLMRFCCPGNRPWDITVTKGGKKGGEMVAKYHRPCACLVSPCKCCCHQSVQVTNVGGQDLGGVKEICWLCIPEFNILQPDGKVQYTLHQPTCCMGMCVNPCAEGCCNCKVPFYIYPTEGDKDKEVGKITKVWGGMAKEMFTDADTFETDFPEGVDAQTKARILGAVFMINQVFFESSKQQGDVVG